LSPVRSDQDLRFGSRHIKAAFYLVKFLEDIGNTGSPHFDTHAYRFDRSAISKRRLKDERLDQLTIDILMGVR
jgi:hypothetical protein